MVFEIHPTEGAGALRFGMTIEQVRVAVGANFRSFKRGVDSQFPTDAFQSLGMFVEYRAPGICTAIEFARPAEVVLFGRQLLGLPFLEVYEWLQAIDPTIETEDAGVTSRKLGVGLYAPFARKSPLEPVEGVIVFEEGYYERS